MRVGRKCHPKQRHANTTPLKTARGRSPAERVRADICASENLMRQKTLVIAFALIMLCPALAAAQGKLLTVEDIYDPVKKVNFGGAPPAELIWLGDSEHYLQGRSAGGATQLMKVDARTGEAVPFFDAAKMEAALAKVKGLSADDAKKLAHRASYKLNPAQNAVLINFGNDLFYYELNSDAALRLTDNPEEES